ncbi:uncharacterized protein LOC134747405 [Cydia strobilella]|uniref:uncharacterized protein LOC134747405 n=1 Tax=Cydia strobilella TaxID=1100964 RepID=UPI003003F692
MEAVLQPPAPFLFENNISSVTSGNLSKAWQNWKNAFNIYCEACELHKKEEKVKTNILLHVIGPKCREVYQQFKVKPTTLQALLKEFDDFFLPKTNTTVERHRFFTREQKPQESAEQYVFELTKMAAKCGFKDLCDDLVKDRLICGIRNTTLRERLLREPDLKLSSALDICRLVEMSQVQASTIKPESETHHVHELSTNSGTNRHEDVEEAVNWVNSSHCPCGARTVRSAPPTPAAAAPGSWEPRGRRRRGRGRGRGRRAPAAVPVQADRAQRPGYSNVSTHHSRSYQVCSRCGGNHAYNKCPAYGVRCDSCNGYNHYAKMCRVYAVEGASSDQVKRHNNNTSSTDWSVTLYASNEHGILADYADIFEGIGCLPGEYRIRTVRPPDRWGYTDTHRGNCD